MEFVGAVEFADDETRVSCLVEASEQSMACMQKNNEFDKTYLMLSKVLELEWSKALERSMSEQVVDPGAGSDAL